MQVTGDKAIVAANETSGQNMICINLFGKLRLETADGKPIPISGSKTQGLIACLALNTDVHISRDRLMTLFWGDRFNDQARQSLRQAISKLRRLLEDVDGDIILADPDRVGFNPDKVRVDVDGFELLAKKNTPDDALSALDLLQGPLLDGLFGQQPDFDDWLASERQRIATIATRVFEDAAKQQMKAGRNDAALNTIRRLIKLDPLRDATQIILIKILAQSGERAAAIQHYNAYAATLNAELGVSAGPDLQRLINEIRSENFMPVEIDEATVSAPLPVETPNKAPTENRQPSIAVLPFATASPGQTQEFFAEGITEDLTANLSLYKWLNLRAGLPFEGARPTAADLAKLGKEHKIDYVVHGMLRDNGAKARLTVQLAETATGRYLWVTRYDRSSDELLDLQDELSDTIAASVEAELERIAGKAAHIRAEADLSAWDNYHLGLATQYEFHADTNLKAQQYFRKAIELDPNFAAAYARLSYAIVISTIYFEADNVQVLLEDALQHARKSCLLDADDAVGRFALGRVFLARGEYDRSVIELQAAIDLNPGMAQAHCGLGDSLAYSGKLDDAMERFEEAVRLSPSDPYRWAFLSYGATALLFKGEYEDSANWALKADSVPNSHYWATAIRASALGHLGHEKQASAALQELLRRKPGIDCDFVRKRLFYLQDPNQIDIYIDGLRKAGLN